MSRRQRTTLVLSVRIPVPAGWKQEQVLAQIKSLITTPDYVLPHALVSQETLVKLERREVVYL